MGRPGLLVSEFIIIFTILMKSYMKNVLIVLWVSLVASNIYAQSLPDSTLKKIDRLFEKWNHPNSPGCAVGVVRNDSLLFGKGYGMANLEYGVPITPTTIFHMASVSKQFTAFSIVLLARQGKLQLDDDIHKYLTWFPDLKEKITIRHLLNHTSGIRDQWQLLTISGTRLDDVITQDHIIKILSRQKALNFKPGEQYNYSNSGFTMLAEIVKAVTGQTLRQFTDSAIFKPLGMHDTHFHDDYTEIVRNRSYSYDRTDSTHYTNSILSYSNAGATSLFTNINDLSKWVMNFYTHKVGTQQDIDLLTQKTRLNNGRTIDYALGIGNITYKGWKGFAHDGADAGYRTVITIFPDLKMGFMVFSNLGDFNPGGRAMDIANLFIEDATPAPAKDSKKTDSSQAILKNPTAMEKFTGDYISDDGMQMHFRINNSKLYADINGRSNLLKEDKDTLSPVNNPGPKLAFKINNPGDTTVLAVFAPEDKQVLRKYVPAPQTDKALEAYTGTYYCPELDCRYGIILKGHQLVLTNNKYDDMPLSFGGPDHLFNGSWWMRHLKVMRNSKRQVTGFEVTAGRVMHLRFDRL